jgi:hypothetical protein
LEEENQRLNALREETVTREVNAVKETYEQELKEMKNQLCQTQLEKKIKDDESRKLLNELREVTKCCAEEKKNCNALTKQLQSLKRNNARLENEMATFRSQLEGEVVRLNICPQTSPPPAAKRPRLDPEQSGQSVSLGPSVKRENAMADNESLATDSDVSHRETDNLPDLILSTDWLSSDVPRKTPVRFEYLENILMIGHDFIVKHCSSMSLKWAISSSTSAKVTNCTLKLFVNRN